MLPHFRARRASLMGLEGPEQLPEDYRGAWDTPVAPLSPSYMTRGMILPEPGTLAHFRLIAAVENYHIIEKNRSEHAAGQDECYIASSPNRHPTSESPESKLGSSMKGDDDESNDNYGDDDNLSDCGSETKSDTSTVSSTAEAMSKITFTPIIEVLTGHPLSRTHLNEPEKNMSRNEQRCIECEQVLAARLAEEAGSEIQSEDEWEVIPKNTSEPETLSDSGYISDHCRDCHARIDILQSENRGQEAGGEKKELTRKVPSNLPLKATKEAYEHGRGLLRSLTYPFWHCDLNPDASIHLKELVQARPRSVGEAKKETTSGNHADHDLNYTSCRSNSPSIAISTDGDGEQATGSHYSRNKQNADHHKKTSAHFSFIRTLQKDMVQSHRDLHEQERGLSEEAQEGRPDTPLDIIDDYFHQMPSLINDEEYGWVPKNEGEVGGELDFRKLH
ncbi:hypothetical protein MKZ38_007430 [Zalerion maritima]|uniref:Uncharacterized protein n=1 Tax=Zalerion maritima TaxID=339359 RepID=A0AAD5WU75_9PEZI|nr:hypothetical protein MKZ38_007430 [Zalerion maritima]